jgi:hypothetical protein
MSIVQQDDTESRSARGEAGTIDPRTAFKLWRIAAWAGPAFLAAVAVGYAAVAGFLPPPNQSWTAIETKHWFLDNQDPIRIGIGIYLLFTGLYTVWSVAISRVIERIEGRRGVLSQIEFGGGVATTVVAALAGVMWSAAAFRTQTRSPGDVQLLMDLGWLIFNTTFSVTAVQMLAIGIAVRLDRRPEPLFPKWVMWIAIVFAAAFVPLLLIPFVNSGPFAWDGVFNYYIALGGAFFFDAVVSFYLFGAIKKIEREERG